MGRLLRFGLLIAGMAAGAACGGDGGTGPANVNLTGSWSATMSPIRGHGLDCTISALEVQLVHSETDLSGSYTVQDIVCNGQHSGPGGGSVVSGTAIGGQLHFHLDDESFDLHGRSTSANLASGTYTIVLTVQGQTYSFTGTWSARRR